MDTQGITMLSGCCTLDTGSNCQGQRRANCSHPPNPSLKHSIHPSSSDAATTARMSVTCRVTGACTIGPKQRDKSIRPASCQYHSHTGPRIHLLHTIPQTAASLCQCGRCTRATACKHRVATVLIRQYHNVDGLVEYLAGTSQVPRQHRNTATSTLGETAHET